MVSPGGTHDLTARCTADEYAARQASHEQQQQQQQQQQQRQQQEHKEGQQGHAGRVLATGSGGG